MRYKNRKGFTLVELLAVVTILGILALIAIASVSKLVAKSKDEQRSQQEKTVSMAAESYMQANSVLLPKAIGETTKVYLRTLKDSNYLKDDVLNASGESCMENSYVVTYKETATKYVYVTHLYCGNEKEPKEEKKPEPTIKIKFYDIDADGREVTSATDTDFLSKVSDPKYQIVITGGTDSNGSEYVVDGYSYSISVTIPDDYGNSVEREVYSTGSLSANMSKRVVIPGDASAGNVSGSLKDYIDITKATNVKIYVVARNTEGVAYERMSSIDGSGTGDSGVTYHDVKKPVCKDITGQAKDANDWYNKANYNEGLGRKITVTCEDNGGSGCVRDKYTKTWPNSMEKSAEFSYIEVSDNAGNKSGKSEECKVRVNVDVEAPIVKLDAYKRNANGGRLNNDSALLSSAQKTSEDAKDDKVTLKSNQYVDLNDGWMNKEIEENGKVITNYKDGVLYEVTISDKYLASYEWKTNEPKINDKNNQKYSKLSENNDGGISKVDLSYANEANCNNKKCTFKLAFVEEGMRMGQLTVIDKAGNKVVYTIEANLDRTPPKDSKCNEDSSPLISYKKYETNENYISNTWTNKNVVSHVQGCASDSLSGWSRFEYIYTYPNGNTTSNIVQKDNTDGFTVTETGTSRIKYRSCDKANNCGVYSREENIKVDKIPPTSPTVTGYKKGKNTNQLNSHANLATAASDTWVGEYILTYGSGSRETSSDQSGLKEYRSSAIGTTPNATQIGPYRNINEQGTSVITYIACDNAGNCSDGNSFIAKIDVTPPSMPSITNYGSRNQNDRSYEKVLSANEWYSGYADSTASGSIDTLSGGVYYVSEIDNASVTPNSTKGTTRSVSKEGYTTVYFKACDAVGNCTNSSVGSPRIALDRTPPVVDTINVPVSDWVNYDFNIQLTAHDNTQNSSNVSQIKNWSYKFGTKETAYANSGGSGKYKFTTTAFQKERNENVYFVVYDNAGNSTTTGGVPIKIDKTDPSCTPIAKKGSASGGNYNNGSTICQNVYTSATCSDTSGAANSGCKNKQYTTTGTTANDTNKVAESRYIKAKGTSTITWTVNDKAGNSKKCSKITVVKGTESEDSSCDCASYEYACTKYHTNYKSVDVKNKPSYCVAFVSQKKCGAGVYNGTSQNVCCKYYTPYTATCTSSTCQKYKKCCHK